MRISCDKNDLDLALIHRFLTEQSAWAKGIPLHTVRKAIEHSLCFGAYIEDRQVAFARVVSDFATFAYLVDVFVLPEHRSKGYGAKLMDAVLAHPDLQGLRRFMLATSSAAGLYARYGFNAPLRPETLMERYDPDVYRCGLGEGAPATGWLQPVGLGSGQGVRNYFLPVQGGGTWPRKNLHAWHQEELA